MFNRVELIVIKSCLTTELTEIQHTINKLINKPKNQTETELFVEALKQFATITEVIQKVDKQLAHKAGDD